MMVKKLQFNKTKKKNKSIETVELPKPEKEYSEKKALEDFRMSNDLHKVGRPKKNNGYANFRTNRDNLGKMKALETVMEFSSHNDLLTYLIKKMELDLNKDQLSTYQLLVKAYQNK